MKKIGLLILLIMAMALFALALSAATGPKAPAAPSAAAVALPATPATAPPEEHPHIHQALESMREAKHHLDSAEHDFHGHRSKAIEHLNQAIREAEICEQER